MRVAFAAPRGVSEPVAAEQDLAVRSQGHRLSVVVAAAEVDVGAAGDAEGEVWLTVGEEARDPRVGVGVGGVAGGADEDLPVPGDDGVFADDLDRTFLTESAINRAVRVDPRDTRVRGVDGPDQQQLRGPIGDHALFGIGWRRDRHGSERLLGPGGRC